MGSRMDGWEMETAEPSELFERLECGILEIVVKLDEKVGMLSEGARGTKRRLEEWLGAMKNRAAAILLHGGEILSEAREPLKALIVGSTPQDTMELRLAHAKSDLPFVEADVNDWAALQAGAIDRKHGRFLRAFLVSELFVLRNGYDHNMLELCRAGAKAIFEKRPVLDLAEMVARDVKRAAIRDGTDYDEVDFSGGKRRVIKTISDGEFERIAIRAMETRRVPAALRPRLLSEVRRAVGEANRGASPQDARPGTRISARSRP